MKRFFVLGAALCLVGLASACSKDEARETATDVYEDAKEGARQAANRAEDVINDRSVEIKDIAFKPESRTVKVGTEVTWLNHDAVTHTVTSNNDVFDSDNIAGDKEFSFRFTQPGEYKYHCEIHGKERMSARILVQ